MSSNSDWLRKIADQADRLGCIVVRVDGETPGASVRIFKPGPTGGFIEIQADFDPLAFLERISIGDAA